jgi:uncharacterized protein YfeS
LGARDQIFAENSKLIQRSNKIVIAGASQRIKAEGNIQRKLLRIPTASSGFLWLLSNKFTVTVAIIDEKKKM